LRIRLRKTGHGWSSKSTQPARRAKGEGGLSEETYNAIRNALLGINPFAPDAKRSEGSNSAGLPACATDLERPGEEGYGGSETQFDADRRSSTLKACSDALPIDVTPGDETRLRAAAQAQVASTPVRGSLMSAPGRSAGAIMIAPDRALRGWPQIFSALAGIKVPLKTARAAGLALHSQGGFRFH